MKALSFGLLLICCYSSVISQPFTASISQASFGSIQVGEKDSILVELENTSDELIELALRPFNDAFIARKSSIAIQGGEKDGFYLVFKPKQNITYNSELLIDAGKEYETVSIDLKGKGAFSSYYSSTFDLWDEALEAELKKIISAGYRSLGYNSARDLMFMTLDNERLNGQGASQNQLTGVYSSTVIKGYSSRSQAQGGGYKFNTEHTYPQSKFSSSEPMKSDLFHLFPTLATANSERGSKPFGTVSNPRWQVGGSKSDNSRFEPRDEQKGRSARAMMYFVLRYSNYGDFFTSQESILRQWHQSFPPDEQEEKRNEGIYNAQKNRNPFIDYPQFNDRISSISGTVNRRAEPKLDLGRSTYVLTSSGKKGESWTLRLFNTGKGELSVSNISSSQAELAVGQSSFTVPPGEDYEISISLAQDISADLNGIELSISSDDSDNPTQKIGVSLAFDPLLSTQSLKEVQPMIYPNPSSGRIHISSGFTLDKLNVYNSQGRLVLSREIQRDALELYTGLEPGLYLIVLQSSRRFFQERLVITGYGR